jgi:hypothetical protein
MMFKFKREHDSFKERVKSLDHDHHESGQGEGPPVVLEPQAGAAALYPGPEIRALEKKVFCF